MCKARCLVWRHRRERLKKCSLHGLEGRPDITFLTYPSDALPDLTGYLLLAVDARPLTAADAGHGLLLVDGTWRHASTMLRQLPPVEARSLPPGWKTAYPRRQDEERGLASVEALFAAYHILGWPTEGLLDHYHWGDDFLRLNNLSL